MKKIFFLAAFCGLSLMTAYAQTHEYSVDGLSLTAGFGYRNFRQAEFSHAGAPAYEGFLASDGTMGDLEHAKGTLPNGAQDDANTTFLKFKNDGGTVSTHDGYSARESSGITLGAAYGLYDDEILRIDLVGNLSYYHIDAADRASFSGNEEITAHKLLGPNKDQLSPGYKPSTVTGEIPENIGKQLQSNAISKFDLRLWTIDLGLSVSYMLGSNLSLYAAAGPTFSIADMESSSFARTSSVATPTYGKTVGGHDNEIEFEWGLYASVGASYMFTENLGMALEMRYDEGFGTVGTKYVKQDLDSWGGVLKMVYQF